MGLLNWGNAFSKAGGALAEVGVEGMKAALEQDKIRLADELAEGRAVRSETRGETRQIATEKRAIENIPLIAGANADAAVANAPKLREIRVADAMAAKQAEIDVETNPDNVEARSKAKVLSDKIVSTGAAETTATLMKDPSYLKNIRDLALAQNPEKGAQIAASMSTVALNNLKVETEKSLKAARTELANADTPEKKASAKQKIEGLEWSVASDRARQTADAAVLNSVEKAIKDARAAAAALGASDAVVKSETETATRLQATYEALLKQSMKDRGVEAPKAGDAPKTGYDTTTKEVWKNGEVIGIADSVEDARAGKIKPAKSATAAKATPAAGERPVAGPAFNAGVAVSDAIGRGIDSTVRGVVRQGVLPLLEPADAASRFIRGAVGGGP